LLKEFLREYPRKWAESQWETIPYQRANHGEGLALHGGGASKMGHEGDPAQPSEGDGCSER